MKPRFFPTQAQFRAWLERNHDKAQELWVGFYKKSSGKASLTWPESVDQALCFGWIDGIRKSIDDISYKIRFTPRNPKSNWSSVNIKRAQELIELGLMTPAGMAAFKNRREDKTRQYSYEQQNVKLKKEYEQKLRANQKAWDYFQSLPPSTQKPSIWWVMSAKKEETRLRRLEILIRSSEKGQKVPPLIISKKQKNK